MRCRLTRRPRILKPIASAEPRGMLHRLEPIGDWVDAASGGGFGHIPVVPDYIGDGFLDACALRDVFVSPDKNSILNSIQFASQGKGILCVLGSYGGHRMIVGIACEMAEMGDVDARNGTVSDGVAEERKAKIKLTAARLGALKSGSPIIQEFSETVGVQPLLHPCRSAL